MIFFNDVVEKQLRENALKEEIAHLDVGAIILSQCKSSMLILKRHPEDFLPNIYEIPSGGLENGENFEQGLFREVFEETGLIANRIDFFVNSFDYFSKRGKPVRQFNFLVSVPILSPIVLSPNEHTEFRWYDIQTVGALDEKMEEILALLR